MITFLGALILLLVGYTVYGKLIERIFGAEENRKTPAYTKNDGVDFVPMDWKRNALIQLLDIAGLGPIYGAISGALWGPSAYLWIVFGGIFAGGVHDYLSGMISIRNGGANVPLMVGKYLGNVMKALMNIFTVILLVLIGATFTAGPAGLMASITNMPLLTWVLIIITYYFIATLLPIDKIIGRIYPYFGALLIIMCFSVGAAMILGIGGHHMAELTLQNLNPKGLPRWPLLFITIACGAVSGFHCTQSPIVARCTKNENEGRKIFYGMMIVESVIALIWAAVAIYYFNGTVGLGKVLATPAGPSGVVKEVSFGLLGPIGGTLAVLGVVVLPITSGDTAFRGARLTIAEFLKWDQVKISKRYIIAIPLIAIGFILTQINFSIIWRYFSWANQTVAMIMLWTGSAYLIKEKKFHWIATIPAIFMTAVSFTYILMAPEGFRIPAKVSYPIGLLITLVITVIFFAKILFKRPVIETTNEK
ncbi:carbon starvation protein A [Thermoanaerobacterium sp. RBIITD]|uniref:carbon starvation CstA family protein n=1 Tax=Thermoanaerobacterium sp. RBIITD TaxID=1550240 RepID=UPI000BB7FEFF|nr:carbon starvation protein A [Thermoanaerobacterium sp. RBIITD]SNX55087.1 Carbon starvation protein CstA [Thermoanaerobacterium sp. RBIITD]